MATVNSRLTPDILDMLVLAASLSWSPEISHTDAHPQAIFGQILPLQETVWVNVMVTLGFLILLG